MTSRKVEYRPAHLLNSPHCADDGATHPTLLPLEYNDQALYFSTVFQCNKPASYCTATQRPCHNKRGPDGIKQKVVGAERRIRVCTAILTDSMCCQSYKNVLQCILRPCGTPLHRLSTSYKNPDRKTMGRKEPLPQGVLNETTSQSIFGKESGKGCCGEHRNKTNCASETI